jgi:hypothetical protein
MSRRRLSAALAFAGALSLPALARAQEHDEGPNMEEVKKKILEIEKLMKSAEEALARSTDTRSAAERSAAAAKKILDQKAQQETGKSAEDLRKEAESGSQQAKDTLERLTKDAQKEADEAAKKMTDILSGNGGQGGSAGGASGGSSGGIKELIEKIKGDGKAASERMKWLLDQRRGGQGGGANQPQEPQKQPDAKEPEKPDKKKPEEKKPETSKKKPESKTEPPSNPEFVQWVAELPPQVRKAVESEDWDSIPPKWREMLRDWTKKMAEESEKESR